MQALSFTQSIFLLSLLFHFLLFSSIFFSSPVFSSLFFFFSSIFSSLFSYLFFSFLLFSNLLFSYLFSSLLLSLIVSSLFSRCYRHLTGWWTMQYDPFFYDLFTFLACRPNWNVLRVYSIIRHLIIWHLIFWYFCHNCSVKFVLIEDTCPLSVRIIPNRQKEKKKVCFLLKFGV